MDPAGRAIDEEAAATRALADYYRAFSTLEVQAVLPYFHEPSLLIGREGCSRRPPPPCWRLRSRL